MTLYPNIAALRLVGLLLPHECPVGHHVLMVHFKAPQYRGKILLKVFEMSFFVCFFVVFFSAVNHKLRHKQEGYFFFP